MNLKQAEQLLHRSMDEAIGYLELAHIEEENGKNTKVMLNKALKTLQKFADNNEAVDLMQELDIRICENLTMAIKKL